MPSAVHWCATSYRAVERDPPRCRPGRRFPPRRHPPPGAPARARARQAVPARSRDPALAARSTSSRHARAGRASRRARASTTLRERGPNARSANASSCGMHESFRAAPDVARDDDPDAPEPTGMQNAIVSRTSFSLANITSNRYRHDGLESNHPRPRARFTTTEACQGAPAPVTTDPALPARPEPREPSLLAARPGPLLPRSTTWNCPHHVPSA